jgi:hypothetical protein
MFILYRWSFYIFAEIFNLRFQHNQVILKTGCIPFHIYNLEMEMIFAGFCIGGNFYIFMKSRVFQSPKLIICNFKFPLVVFTGNFSAI